MELIDDNADVLVDSANSKVSIVSSAMNHFKPFQIAKRKGPIITILQPMLDFGQCTTNLHSMEISVLRQLRLSPLEDQKTYDVVAYPTWSLSPSAAMTDAEFDEQTKALEAKKGFDSKNPICNKPVPFGPHFVQRKLSRCENQLIEQIRASGATHIGRMSCIPHIDATGMAFGMVIVFPCAKIVQVED